LRQFEPRHTAAKFAFEKSIELRLEEVMIDSRFTIALGLASVLALSACSQQSTPGSTASAPTAQQAAPANTAAAQATTSDAPQQAAAAPTPTTQVITIKQDSIPQVVQNGSAKAPDGFAAPSAGPNLLSKNWNERLGVLVSDYKAPTGKPVLDPKAGDLWFFSNASTTWGATNTKNSVWVIDAKTKKTVAEIAPADGEGYSSHGIFVSGDAKFIYLPELGKDNHIDVLDGRTLEIVQTIKTLGRPHHHKLWHDPNTNKDLIIGEDFNWSWAGSGVYVIDPSQNNAVVGGMSNGDFEGNPYVTTPASDGSFIVVTMPAPMPAFRDKMDGWVAKVDPKTWKVIGMVPMIDPLWAAVSLDNKYAYVTSGGEAATSRPAPAHGVLPSPTIRAHCTPPTRAKALATTSRAAPAP
jgi:hypothetical protein